MQSLRALLLLLFLPSIVQAVEVITLACPEKTNSLNESVTVYLAQFEVDNITLTESVEDIAARAINQRYNTETNCFIPSGTSTTDQSSVDRGILAREQLDTGIARTSLEVRVIPPNLIADTAQELGFNLADQENNQNFTASPIQAPMLANAGIRPQGNIQFTLSLVSAVAYLVGYREAAVVIGVANLFSLGITQGMTPYLVTGLVAAYRLEAHVNQIFLDQLAEHTATISYGSSNTPSQYLTEIDHPKLREPWYYSSTEASNIFSTRINELDAALSGVYEQTDRTAVIANFKNNVHTYPEQLALIDAGVTGLFYASLHIAGHITEKLFYGAVSSPLTGITLAQAITTGGAKLLFGYKPSELISIFPYQDDMRPLAFPDQWLYGAKVALTDYFWFSMYGLYKGGGFLLRAMTHRRTYSSSLQ